MPIGVALFEKYGSSVSDEELADLIEAMLPIELTSLGLSGRVPAPDRPDPTGSA